ncbi:MAG: histidine phosphatase family protein [Chthoniobacterales bacterium]|nr:histidine phosphatase family protein [Chthoniobacterales bacterium]
MKFFKLCFLSIIGLSLFCVSASAAAPKTTDQLIFAVDVIRHGDRNPIRDIPKAPHLWPEGLQQLTPLGMHQEYELGKKHRQRYVFQEKLLPRSYQPETIYVRSTDVDRTLMSAQCFLMGLYPPGTGPLIAFPFQPALPHRFQPISIHTVAEKEDLMGLPNNFKELVQKNVCSTSLWQKKTAEVKPHLVAWSKVTGLPLTSVNDIDADAQLGLLGDTLLIDQLKHVSFPKGLNKEDVATIIATGDWRFTAMFQNPKIGKATGGALLRDIAHYLKQAAQEKTKLKYVLYFGHDVTLLALMSALGTPLNKTPGYASDVNIALFVRSNGEKYVQVMMNGKAVELPGSEGSNLSLDRFITLAKK